MLSIGNGVCHAYNSNSADAGAQRIINQTVTREETYSPPPPGTAARTAEYQMRFNLKRYKSCKKGISLFRNILLFKGVTHLR